MQAGGGVWAGPALGKASSRSYRGTTAGWEPQETLQREPSPNGNLKKGEGSLLNGAEREILAEGRTSSAVSARDHGCRGEKLPVPRGNPCLRSDHHYWVLPVPREEIRV